GERLAALEGGLESTPMDGLSTEMLASILQTMGLLGEGNGGVVELSLEKPAAAFYERWVRRSIGYLQEKGLIGDDGRVREGVRELGALWAEWKAQKLVWGNPDRQAQIALLEACLEGLPEILRGRRGATD